MCARERLSVESLLLQWKEPAEVVRHLLRKRPASYWGNVFLVRPPQSRHPWRDWGSWLPSAFPQKSWGEGGIVTVGLIPHSLGSDEEQGWMDKWNFIVLICFIWILKKTVWPLFVEKCIMNKDLNKEPTQILLTHLLTPSSGQISFERSPLTPFIHFDFIYCSLPLTVLETW